MTRPFLLAFVASAAALAVAQEAAVISLGTIENYSSGGVSNAMLSPDGKRVAFRYLSHLRLVDLASKHVQELRSDVGEFQTFGFAEDGKSVIVGANQKFLGPAQQDERYNPGRTPPAAKFRVNVKFSNNGHTITIVLTDRAGGNERILDSIGFSWSIRRRVTAKRSPRVKAGFNLYCGTGMTGCI